MSYTKQYLVTGGAGFIGSHLVEKLLTLGHSVVCLDNFNDYYNPAIKRANLLIAAENPNFKLIEGDIIDTSLLEKIFKDYAFDGIVHLAARAGVRPSLVDPILYERVNVQGTINLLEAARKAELKKFIFGSSSSVYGTNSKVPFSEDDPINRPISPYAATKRSAELMCYTYHHLYRMPITCLRFFTVYGPRQRPEMAIHMFVRQIENEEPIKVFGDGTTKRDYTFIDDIIDGVIKALNNDDGFEIYNLGESELVELKYLISLIEKNLGKQAIVHSLPDQPGDVPITYADVSKAKSRLGYSPSVNIEEGIKAFVEWYRDRIMKEPDLYV